MREGQNGEGQMKDIKPEGEKKNIALGMIARGRSNAEHRRKGMEALRGIAEGAKVMLYAREAQLLLENQEILEKAGVKKSLIDVFASNVESVISELDFLASDVPENEAENPDHHLTVNIYNNALQKLAHAKNDLLVATGYPDALQVILEKARRMPSFDKENLPAKEDPKGSVE